MNTDMVRLTKERALAIVSRLEGPRDDKSCNLCHERLCSTSEHEGAQSCMHGQVCNRIELEEHSVPSLRRVLLDHYAQDALEPRTET